MSRKTQPPYRRQFSEEEAEQNRRWDSDEDEDFQRVEEMDWRSRRGLAREQEKGTEEGLRRSATGEPLFRREFQIPFAEGGDAPLAAPRKIAKDRDDKKIKVRPLFLFDI